MDKFVYITSSSYSGSTLLSFLLGSHPEIATVGELASVKKMFTTHTNYRCSCGELFEKCQLWNEVDNELLLHNPKISLKKIAESFTPDKKNLFDRFYSKIFNNNFISIVRDYIINKLPNQTKHYREINQKYLLLVKTILNITNKSIFLDASKHPNRIGFLYPLLDNNLKVIHLIKDGRAVLDSFIRYNNNALNQNSKNETRYINSWIRINTLIENEIKSLSKENVYQLSYSQLINDNDNQMKLLFDFIGVSNSYNYKKFRQIDHHIIGNKMRVEKTNELYFDEKWKDGLNQHQLLIFDKLAGEINQKYGFR